MTSVDARRELVPKYLKRLSDDFEILHSDDGCFVVTPFIRPDGEAIELEVESLPNGDVRISDMGYTLGYLFVNGLTLNKSMIDRAKFISKGYGVSLDDDAFSVVASPESAGDALHRLLQAVISATDLIHLRRSTIRLGE